MGLRQKQELDHKKNTIKMELEEIKNREAFLLLELDKVHKKINEINECLKKKSRKSLFTRLGNMLHKIVHYIFKTPEHSNVPQQVQSHVPEINDRVQVQESPLPDEETSYLLAHTVNNIRETRKIYPTSTFIDSVLSQNDREDMLRFSFSSEIEDWSSVESEESNFSEKDCDITVIEVARKKLSPSSSWLQHSSISSTVQLSSSPTPLFEDEVFCENKLYKCKEDFYEINSKKYKM